MPRFTRLAQLTYPLAMLMATMVLADEPTDTSALQGLQRAYGGDRLLSVGTFSYRLRLLDADGSVLRDGRYQLDLKGGRLHVENLLEGSRSWWDGRTGWRLMADGRWLSLAEDEAAQLSGHVATHFMRLWRDPATRVETLGSGRLRILPGSAAAFEVMTDPETGLIVENRFGNGTVALESEYRDIGGVMWPMRFEIRNPGQPTVHGQFSETALGHDSSLPPVALEKGRGTVETSITSGAVRVAPGIISTPRNEYNLSLNEAAGLLVFARSDADFANSRLWHSRRGPDGWGAPREVPFTDPRYRDSDPWLTPDGKTLYFISDRPAEGRAANRRDLDIWQVALSAKGEWGQPEHLGAQVNSVGHELGPELHAGVLYFNSSRPGGPAGLSLYSAAQSSDGGFADPIALPAPFNAGAVQGDFTRSPDGRLALFWSRRGDRADLDLFAVRREGDGWAAEAQRLPVPFNSDEAEFTPAFSADGLTVYFASERAPSGFGEAGAGAGGMADLYAVPVSTLDRWLEETETGARSFR